VTDAGAPECYKLALIGWRRRLAHPQMAIELYPHDPAWQPAFDRARTELLRVAVGGCAIAIEHVGSTALSDIVAKPIIDIVVGVTASQEVADLCERLHRIGYEDWYGGEGRVTLRRAANDSRPGIHLHIVKYGDRIWSDLILFRNWLSTNATERKRYERLKQSLARLHTDSRRYSDAKSEFVQRILAQARNQYSSAPREVCASG